MALKRELAELWDKREVLDILVRRDLNVRYKNTRLGFVWSLLNPLIQVVVITTVLKFTLRIDVPNYAAYIFCAVLPWSFFQLSLMDASDSILKHYSLIKKVYFPREIIPLATVIANLIHFLLATGVFLVFMALLPLFWWAVAGDRPVWALQPTLLLAPVLMAILFLLVTGLAFFISAANVFFEDVRYLVTAGMSILYYAVPIIYFPEFLRYSTKIPPSMRQGIYTLYMLNPLAALISTFRKLILVPTQFPTFNIHSQDMTLSWADVAFVGVALVTSLVIAVAGYAYFNHMKPRFAERQ
jgi:ABC-type polysaccharide/polyol phosphate export permease